MILGLLLSVFSFNCFSAYNAEAYGEKDFDEYYGARNLIYRIDDYSGNVIFEEDEIITSYPENLIQKDLKEFSFFFFNELSNSLSCPQSELTKMYDYLQFSNRVLVLSYLYENLNSRTNLAKSLDRGKSCFIDWKETIKTCDPKTSDMKFFVKSAKHIIKNKKPYYASSSSSLKKSQANWQKSISTQRPTDEAGHRIQSECENGGCYSLNQSISKLDTTCKDDLKLFTNICSERDRIYGLGYINESYPLLTQSDILDVADTNGFARGCLRKFKNITKNKEIIYEDLKSIFPITYEQMLQKKKRYIQGDLFPAGSMKKFIDMGLVDLFKEKKIVKKEIKMLKEKVKFKKIPVEDKVEFIDRFVKSKVEPRKKIPLKKIKKKKKRIKQSTFLIAVNLRDQLDIDEVRVDMSQFKYDFLFSIKLREILDNNLKAYTTRVGLEDMSRTDSLGKKKGPMPLMFLKYLIETNKHQALYNLTSIVGDKFYVRNDIDKLKSNPYDFIELKNDATTNHKWQIIILRPVVAPLKS